MRAGSPLLTPDGHLARYFYGVDYDPKDLKLGLIEASGNKIGSLADQVLLFCYHDDPASGKYTATVLGALRVAAIVTLLVIIGGLARLSKGAVSP